MYEWVFLCINSDMLYDRLLLWLLIGLTCFGFIVSSSATVPIGINVFNDPFYFIKREIFYYFFTFVLSIITLQIPIIIWKRFGYVMLLCSFIMLLVILIHNHAINGASRWITVGVFCFQPSELCKLSFICYLASYLDRKSKEVCKDFWGICKPIMVMALLSLLLLSQPDFGTVIILCIITLSALFLCGARSWQLMFLFLINICLVMLSVTFKPYRLQRILAFWNPWKDPFGNGYQLTQSLIAFGHGSYFGNGLGNSVQKLEYLPEAHTDFIFSVIGEEFGFIGSFLVLFALFIFMYRAMIIGYWALTTNRKFEGVLACSIGIWLSCQVFINIGVVVGILPTKGLTLPFFSYGGSSFLITTIASILLIRIDFETRLMKSQIFKFK